MHYKCKAMTTNGRYVEEQIEADNPSHARTLLKRKNLTAVTVTEYKAHSQEPDKTTSETDNKQRPNRPQRINRAKAAHTFLDQLNQLMDSGMPVGDAVKTISLRVTEPVQKYLSRSLWKQLGEGSSLAKAMSAHPEIFEKTMTHMIEAGEATGNLKPVIGNLLELIENRMAMKKKIMSGLAYPALLTIVAINVVLFFLFYLLPKVRNMMESLGGEMNLPSRILIGSSEFIFASAPFIITALLLSLLALIQWRKTSSGREITDAWQLKIPLIQKIVYCLDIARVTNLTSIMLQSGVNTTEALRLVEKNIRNADIKKRFRQARSAIHDGASFSGAFSKYKLLNRLDVDILGISEKTGNIARGFRNLYEQKNREISESMQLLTTAICSGSLIFALSLVALLAFSIVTSIMQLSKSVLAH